MEIRRRRLGEVGPIRTPSVVPPSPLAHRHELTDRHASSLHHNKFEITEQHREIRKATFSFSLVRSEHTRLRREVWQYLIIPVQISLSTSSLLFFFHLKLNPFGTRAGITRLSL
ncbi:hypothetical protein QN277_019200 [Acacia crassicarpa]|uniref:Uncharacterized protein n=1 Tax=Acacia crassicarpa TaxID=499986 RepID=A0AAE1JTC8_9FABA|nr:hypothetical protein QN277_019200 [Acacia crassicarpa]